MCTSTYCKGLHLLVSSTEQNVIGSGFIHSYFGDRSIPYIDLVPDRQIDKQTNRHHYTLYYR